MIEVYALSNCDTCRKALKWLDANGISYDAHDIRKDGIKKEILESAIAQIGWETVLNKRSTTWRTLNADDQQQLDDLSATTLILANSTLMKRPLFVAGDHYLVGFGEHVREYLLTKFSN